MTQDEAKELLVDEVGVKELIMNSHYVTLGFAKTYNDIRVELLEKILSCENPSEALKKEFVHSKSNQIKLGVLSSKITEIFGE